MASDEAIVRVTHRQQRQCRGRATKKEILLHFAHLRQLPSP